MELRITQITIPSRKTAWRLHGIGDIHWGAAACDETALRAKVKEVADDPLAYWFGMGDYIEGIGHRDPRFDAANFPKGQEVGTLDDLFMYQVRKLVAILEPIKAKCLGMLVGNHEESVRLHSTQDPGKSLAELMGVPDLRYSAAVRINVRCEPTSNHSYHINWFGHHGWGGGRFASSKVMRIDQHMNDVAPINSDIVMMGHVHGSLWAGIKPWMGVTDEGEIALIPKHRAMALTGTYYKTWVTGTTTYSEKVGLPMARIGSPYIEIRLAEMKVAGPRGRLVKKEVPTYKAVS